MSGTRYPAREPWVETDPQGQRWRCEAAFDTGTERVEVTRTPLPAVEQPEPAATADA